MGRYGGRASRIYNLSVYYSVQCLVHIIGEFSFLVCKNTPETKFYFITSHRPLQLLKHEFKFKQNCPSF